MEMYLAMIAEYQSLASLYATVAREARDNYHTQSVRYEEHKFYSARSAYYALQARHMVMELLNK